TRHESTVRLGLHGRRDRASRHARAGPELSSQAIHAGRARAKGAGRAGRHMNWKLLGAGAALVVAAGVHAMWLAPRWTQRLPPGWTASPRYAGPPGYRGPRTRTL